MLIADLLNTTTAPAFAALTFPRFRERLLNLASFPQTVAVGASQMGRQVGLVVGNVQKDGLKALASSVYVLPQYRNSGVATELLGRLEDELRQRGCNQIGGHYQTGKPSASAVEKVLAKRDWEAPALDTIVFMLDGARLLSGAKWLQTLGELPPGFSFFPWRDLSADEQQAIAGQQDWIPDFVTPHANHEFEPHSSIGLRFNGEIVGWYIHRHLDAETVTVEAWVKPELHRVGRSFLLAGLIRESVSRVLPATNYKYGRVTPAWPPMVSFSRRHLTSWCASVTETYYARKALV